MKRTIRVICLAALLALVHPAASMAAHEDSRVPAGVARSVTASMDAAMRLSDATRTPARQGVATEGASALSASVSAAGIELTIPADPAGKGFDFYSTPQPYSPTLIHQINPEIPAVEDHVYVIWLEVGEDAAFVIDGPDDPAVDLDLYVYPPGSNDFGDPSISFADTGSDEGILIEDVIVEGYWFVRVNSFEGTGDPEQYDFYWGFESPDDDIPGVPFSGYTLSTRLDAYSDCDDVVSLWLTEGEVVSLRLDYPIREHWSLSLEPEMHLYGPGATSVWSDEPVASSTIGDSFQHRFISYLVPKTGRYYLDLYQPPMPTSTHNADFVTLTRTSRLPVFRFYNARLGTHFYTASAAEMNNVKATLSHIFTFEGPAYYMNPAANTQKLHRFYLKSSGTHFYTANEAEKANVMNTLSHVYAYEGPAYNVSSAPGAGRTTVYRFYHRSNGTHFYTASEAERNSVIASLSHVYGYEGPAFWIGQ